MIEYYVQNNQINLDKYTSMKQNATASMAQVAQIRPELNCDHFR